MKVLLSLLSASTYLAATLREWDPRVETRFQVFAKDRFPFHAFNPIPPTVQYYGSKTFNLGFLLGAKTLESIYLLWKPAVRKLWGLTVSSWTWKTLG